MDNGWLALLTPRSSNEVMERIADGLGEMMSGGNPDERSLIHEVELRRKDGSSFLAEANTTLIFDDDGNLVKLIGAIRDIQERKRIQQRYLAAKKQAEFYLDVFSHDITTINKGVIGHLERTVRDLGLEGTEVTYINNTLEQSRRICELVNNLDLLTQLREEDLKVENLDPLEILHAATDEVCAKYSNRDIKIYIEEKGSPCLVRASSMLKDVFENLIDNAVKYERHVKAVIHVKTRPSKDGKRLRLEFIDRGMGVPDGFKKEIFNRLVGGKTGVGGSGLGLAMVREYVHKVGGKVWVEDRVKNKSGMGSRFIIELPLAEGDSQGRHRHQPRSR